MQKSDSGGDAIRYRYHQLDECFLLPEVDLQSRQNRARHGFQLVTEELAHAAARAATQGAVPLSKNGYKLPVFETLVRRAVLAAGTS
jgi:hypothetical protein